MTITKHGRFFALCDAEGELIAITVYKKGALEIIRRLNAGAAVAASSESNPEGPHGNRLANGGKFETGEARVKAHRGL